MKITLHAKPGDILAQFKDHRRLPALNIAWQVRHFSQSRAPIGFNRQLVGRNRLARAAPDTLAAVIFLQPAPQRPGGHRLQLWLDRRADRQAAPEEFFFAKGARQLTPNLIGEIAARGQRLTEGRIIAVLHRAQRLLALAQIGGLVDIAVLPHLTQHIVPPLQKTVFAAHRMKLTRGLWQRRQHRRFMRGKGSQRFVEIGLRSGGHTIAVLA